MAACSGGADPRAAELWLPLELPRGLLLLWRLGRWGGSRQLWAQAQARPIP